MKCHIVFADSLDEFEDKFTDFLLLLASGIFDRFELSFKLTLISCNETTLNCAEKKVTAFRSLKSLLTTTGQVPFPGNDFLPILLHKGNLKSFLMTKDKIVDAAASKLANVFYDVSDEQTIYVQSIKRTDVFGFSDAKSDVFVFASDRGDLSCEKLNKQLCMQPSEEASDFSSPTLKIYEYYRAGITNAEEKLKGEIKALRMFISMVQNYYYPRFFAGTRKQSCHRNNLPAYVDFIKGYDEDARILFLRLIGDFKSIDIRFDEKKIIDKQDKVKILRSMLSVKPSDKSKYERALSFLSMLRENIRKIVIPESL